MAERKRWNKHQDLYSSRSTFPFTTTADPVVTKQVQYIKVLEERNRIKKRLAASKRNDRLQQREEAFVTAFNVPVRAALSTALVLGSSSNTKSATSLVPSKVPDKREEAQCSSAPSTTLNFAASSREKQSNRVRGAKWHRPQVPMVLTANHQAGESQLRLPVQEESEEKGGVNENDKYLNEFVEEFEEDGEQFSCPFVELEVNEVDESVGNDTKFENNCRPRAVSNEKIGTRRISVEAFGLLNASVDLAQTTKDLFGMLQHLSRTKQRDLVTLLQPIQARNQQHDNAKTVQNSLDDPTTWKEITTVLKSLPPMPAFAANEKGSDNSVRNNTLIASDTRVYADKWLGKQLRVKDENANERTMELARNRKETKAWLEPPEECRVRNQFDNEEREREQIPDYRRNERLARLSALQVETKAALPAGKMVKDETTELKAKGTDKLTDTKRRKSREINEEANNTSLGIKQSNLTAKGIVWDANKTFVPTSRLNCSISLIKEAQRFEIDLKLLSTWGQTRAVSLAQISVYNLYGDELSVDLTTLQLYDQSSGQPLPKTNDMVRRLPNLFNGVTQPNTEKDLWLGRLGESGLLLVKFTVPSPPSKLCIWNNNSRLHAAACTRDLEVVVCGKSIWTGSLPERVGNIDDNICTWIDLRGLARKGIRTKESSTFTNGTSSTRKTYANDAQWFPQKQISSRGNQSSPTKEIPVWLSDTASSSLVIECVPASSPSAGLNLSLARSTPRRRRQKPLSHSLQSSTNEAIDQALANRVLFKSYSSQVTKDQNEEMTHNDNETAAPAVAACLSSWDSLETFSHTNRNAFAPPRNVEKAVCLLPSNCLQAFASTSASHTVAKSALVTALRQGIMPSLSTSSESMRNGSFDSVISNNRFTSRRKSTPATIETHPLLPAGKWLQIEILSTWGDPYYVGLNGVEIFNQSGKRVHFQDPGKQITACPESINVLAENSVDPRVPQNLVDGVNFTCDDLHMWLAPYTLGQTHYVLLTMESQTSISMVRIWNYNKSRTHTCRGVREARLVVYDNMPTHLVARVKGVRPDRGRLIFRGEIRQAPGFVDADSIDDAHEVIRFTYDPAILQAIEANDIVLQTLAHELERGEGEGREIVNLVHQSLELRRPRTSNADSRTSDRSNDDKDQLVDSEGRARIVATRREEAGASASIDVCGTADLEAAQLNQRFSTTEGEFADANLPRGRYLTLRLHSTWGDLHYVGLTEVQVLIGSRGTRMPIELDILDATPRDLASLGYSKDPRTLDKLFDGVTTTCEDTHMWLIPFESATAPEVHIKFTTAQHFFGLRIWNYNKSLEDTVRGVKQLIVLIDGVAISPRETGFLLRKAPGVADFDFGQLVMFAPDKVNTLSYSERVRYPFRSLAYKRPIIRQDYEAPLYPQGFLLKIICWTTWGDPYYLGLNGLELYNFAGARIVEKPTIVTAVPFSVSEMEDGTKRQQDTRIPENLVSGKNKNVWDAHDAWLAPLASSLGTQQGNIVYIGFDTPIVLSMIKFWNYSKTPKRGVKDVEIHLDDMHLFSGTLKEAPKGDDLTSSSRFGTIHKVTENFGQPVLFTSSQAQVDTEKRNVVYCGVGEQDVLKINDGQVMHESETMYRNPDSVVADLKLRPMTAEWGIRRIASLK